MMLRRPFCSFSFRHSHGRNFAPIFLKIADEVESCLPLFTIENQQDQLVTSGDRENRVEQKIEILARKIFFLRNRASKVSIFTNSDP